LFPGGLTNVSKVGPALNFAVLDGGLEAGNLQMTANAKDLYNRDFPLLRWMTSYTATDVAINSQAESPY
jgi:hypothetical protein